MTAGSTAKGFTLKSVARGFLSLTGALILDPIEVFYLPEQNTFYPIISKSGCSSIKLMLIRLYQPDYQARFPDIHHVNPSTLTDNKVQRLFFKTRKAYRRFAQNKKAVVVIREPYSRIYSCYLDVNKGKNNMYQEPVNLDWMRLFKPNIDFTSFIQTVYRIPDRLSDRHFRTQAFCFSADIEKAVQAVEIQSLEDFMRQRAAEDGRETKLNTNKSSITPEIFKQLRRDPHFNQRYRADLELYRRAKS